MPPISQTKSDVGRVASIYDDSLYRFPPARMNGHFVADLDVFDLRADGPDDAGAIAAAGREVLWFTFLLAIGDDG